MRKIFLLLLCSFLLGQAVNSAYASEAIYTPAYSVEDALELPSSRQMAVEMLWSRWKEIPPAQRGKTGLVLSGGGARGFGHVGVLRHLLEIGFPIEAMAGTSMGAVMGGLYAAGIPIADIETMADDSKFKNLARFTTFTLLKLGFNDGTTAVAPWGKWLKDHLGKKTFADLKIPLVVCATDLASGELVLLREGDLATIFLAAGTAPGIFAPVAYRQYFLVDGGLLLNVPVEAMSLLNVDNILISDVSARGHVDPMTRSPSSLAALYRVIEIQGNRLDYDSYKEGDYRLRFYPSGIDLFELWRWKEAWEVGLRSARDNSLDLRLAFTRKAVLKQGGGFFRPMAEALAPPSTLLKTGKVGVP